MKKWLWGLPVVVVAVWAVAAYAKPVGHGVSARTEAGGGTVVSIPVPSPGDVSYGVAQVLISSGRGHAPVSAGATIFYKRIGGLAIAARSGSWSTLRRDTKVYVVVASGAGRGMREVVFFVTRRKTNRSAGAGGSVTFQIPNASAVSGTFLGRGEDRHGVARIFEVRNMLSTAIDNWSRYLGFLKAAHGIRAALDSVGLSRVSRRADAPATAAPAKATGRLWTGGQNPDADARRVFRLAFGALRNPWAFGWAKRSPIVTRFIAHDLNNAPLAQRWKRVVMQLPLAVPDKYAAAAQQESKFKPARKPAIVSDETGPDCNDDSVAYLFCVYGIGQPVNLSVIAEGFATALLSTPAPPGGPQESVVVKKVGQGSVVGNPTITINNVLGGPSSNTVPGDATINCGQTCDQTLLSGKFIQLQANAAAGWVFSGWSGCTSTEDNTVLPTTPPADGGAYVTAPADTCAFGYGQVTATAPVVSLTATFVPERADLTVSTAGFGSGTIVSSPSGIDCSSPCMTTSSVLVGEQFTLTAAAGSGYVFGGWSGCDSTSTDSSGDPTCTVTMNGDRSVQATFNPASMSFSPSLTVSTAGSGMAAITSSPAGINCTTPCSTGGSASFVSQQQVTLTAVIAAGSVFGGWSGCDSTSTDSSGDPTCTVTMTDDRTVQATANGGTGPSLTASTAGSGVATITSSPAGINCTTPCSTGGSASFATGQQVTLTAVSAAGSVFSSWASCDSTGMDSSGDPTCTVTMNDDRSVIAAIATAPLANSQYAWSNMVGTLPNSSIGPTGVSIAGGDLWVSDPDQAGGGGGGPNQIYEYTNVLSPSATPALTIGSGSDFNAPRQAAFDPYRTLVDISDTANNRVAQYGTSGGSATFVQNLPGTFNTPEGVAIDPGSGTIAVAETGANQIDEFTADGTLIRNITTYGPSSTTFSAPFGVAFDAAGNLWVADTLAHKVEEFDLSGNLITSWSVPSPGLADPTGIAVDPDGDVFLARSNDVEEYTSAGTFIATIASNGTGNGQVQNPATVAVDETTGDLYVADTGNNRIQRWVLVP